jgi:hypothetical protein
MTLRRSLLSAIAAFALVLAVATSAAAQHMGHGAGAGTSGATHGAMNPMMAGGQSMRNVDTMLQHAESMMRTVTAMPEMGAQHAQMVDGMNGMLGQMRAMHGNLTSMMKDPALMHDQSAGKALTQASRDFEKIAAGFESMARNMSQAMKGPHHGGK